MSGVEHTLARGMRGLAGWILTLALLLAFLLAGGLATAAPQGARDVVLVLDNSGSMKHNDPQFLTKRAVTAFLEHLSGDIRVAILIFDQRVDLAVPLSPLDEDTRLRLLASLARVDYRGQFTNSPDAVERAIYELKIHGRPHALRDVIFLTDGIVDTGDPDRDRESARWMRNDLADDAARHGVRVFGIAFTDNADFRLIQSLTLKTGGEYFRAPRAQDIEPVLMRIAEAMDEPEESASALPPDVPSPEEGEPQAAAGASPQGAVAEPPETQAAPVEEPPRSGETPTASVAPEPQGSAPASVPGSAPLLGRPSEPPQDRPVAEPAPPKPMPVGTEGTRDHLFWLTVAVGVLAAAAFLMAAYLLLHGRRARTRANAPGGTVIETGQRVFLDDLGGATDKLRHELVKDRTTIGRMLHGDDPAAQHIQLARDTISRLHASIERKRDKYWLVEHGSINGTYLNGEQVHGKRRLKSGDHIRFHDFEFSFLVVASGEDGQGTVVATDDRTKVLGNSAPPPARQPPVGDRTVLLGGSGQQATTLLHSKGPSTADSSSGDATVILGGSGPQPPTQPLDADPPDGHRTQVLGNGQEQSDDRTVTLGPNPPGDDKTAILKPKVP
jgi:pSer/pThr/pTyr-binding forkhead associated (FHA) protein